MDHASVVNFTGNRRNVLPFDTKPAMNQPEITPFRSRFQEAGGRGSADYPMKETVVTRDQSLKTFAEDLEEEARDRESSETGPDPDLTMQFDFIPEAEPADSGQLVPMLGFFMLTSEPVDLPMVDPDPVPSGPSVPSGESRVVDAGGDAFSASMEPVADEGMGNILAFPQVPQGEVFTFPGSDDGDDVDEAARLTDGGPQAGIAVPVQAGVPLPVNDVVKLPDAQPLQVVPKAETVDTVSVALPEPGAVVSAPGLFVASTDPEGTVDVDAMADATSRDSAAPVILNLAGALVPETRQADGPLVERMQPDGKTSDETANSVVVTPRAVELVLVQPEVFSRGDQKPGQGGNERKHPGVGLQPVAPILTLLNNQAVEGTTISRMMDGAPGGETVSAGILHRMETLQQAMDRFDKHLLEVMASSKHEMLVRLSPPNLGNLLLRVRNQTDGVALEIVAQSPLVREIVQGHAANIRDVVAGNGYRLASFDVRTDDDRHQSRARQGRPQTETPLPFVRGRMGGVRESVEATAARGVSVVPDGYPGLWLVA